MVLAGTDIATFRGFVQECTTKTATAKSMAKEDSGLAEAVSFVGCRGSKESLLYKDIFDK
jgi:sulfite reductase alpha subunit-like flavoprotein